MSNSPTLSPSDHLGDQCHDWTNDSPMMRACRNFLGREHAELDASLDNADEIDGALTLKLDVSAPSTYEAENHLEWQLVHLAAAVVRECCSESMAKYYANLFAQVHNGVEKQTAESLQKCVRAASNGKADQ